MTKVKLNSADINFFSEKVSKVLRDVPLFYINEILELANEDRVKEGADPDLDTTSSEEELSDDEIETETESEESSSEEENDD